MGIPDSIQDTHRDVSLLAYLWESLPSYGWARASSLLGYQKAQPIIGRSRERTTSQASRVTAAEARRIWERGDLQREDQGIPQPTHPTTIIPGQRQGLALKFTSQALSWKAALQMGWSIRGSGVVWRRISTHLWRQIQSTIQGKRPSSQAVPDIRATCTGR